jgi:hypothetical protein
VEEEETSISHQTDPFLYALLFYVAIINGTDARFSCPDLRIAQVAKVFRTSNSPEPLTFHNN